MSSPEYHKIRASLEITLCSHLFFLHPVFCQMFCTFSAFELYKLVCPELALSFYVKKHVEDWKVEESSLDRS